MIDVVYLSRRNLLALLAKLDANIVKPNLSQCSIIKHQPGNMGAPFRQSMEGLVVVAVEDEVFYGSQGRAAGEMHPREEVNLPKPSTGVEAAPDLSFDSVGLSDDVEVE